MASVLLYCLAVSVDVTATTAREQSPLIDLVQTSDDDDDHIYLANADDGRGISYVGDWIAATHSGKRRPRSATTTGESVKRRSCGTVSYHVDSEVGRQASCPFDWVINYESRRIPKRIVEQVCQSCRSCEPNGYCAQLKVRYEVFFRDVMEYSQLEVRAGCICIPHEVGSTSNPYDILV